MTVLKNIFMNTFKINPCTKLYSQLAWMGYQTTGLSFYEKLISMRNLGWSSLDSSGETLAPRQSSPELGVQPVLQLFRNDVSATRE